MYCTRADIELRYGAKHLETLVAEDVDFAGAVASACLDAAALIDGYIGKRYTVPLATVPHIITSYAVDIACWKLAPDHGRLTEQIEKRAKIAIDYFRDIAAGKAAIAALETASGAPGAEVSEVSDSGAVFVGSARRFRDGGLP